MIYCCENPACGFLFKRLGDVECCPACDNSRVRDANEQEAAQFMEKQKHPEVDKQPR